MRSIIQCGVQVRSAKRSDLDEVYLIELSSFDNPYPRWYLDILYSLSNDGEYFLVSIDGGGRIDGYIAAIPRIGSLCHIASLAVRNDCRRRHVGSALLQSLFEVCEPLKLSLYVLEVDMWNMAAQILYARHGFAYIGLISNYYGGGRHGIIMAKMVRGIINRN